MQALSQFRSVIAFAPIKQDWNLALATQFFTAVHRLLGRPAGEQLSKSLEDGQVLEGTRGQVFAGVLGFWNPRHNYLAVTGCCFAAMFYWFVLQPVIASEVNVAAFPCKVQASEVCAC